MKTSTHLISINCFLFLEVFIYVFEHISVELKGCLCLDLAVASLYYIADVSLVNG